MIAITHLWYPRHDYSKGYAQGLRGHWYSVVEIPRETLHAQIHAEVTHIPVPRGDIAKEAYKHLLVLEFNGAISKRDPVEKRLGLFIAFFDGCYYPTADAFRKQLDVIRRFYRPP